MLPHIAARALGTPLLIQRGKLDLILSVLGTRIGLPESMLFPVGDPPAASSPTLAAPPDIAVIPVHGTLVKRAPGIQAASGLLAYDTIAAQLDAALAEPAVNGILLDLDSPGGEVGGCFDLARQVRAACAVKPVWAVANDAAFSAAYAIGCSAERLLVTETGGVGSIGVIAMHVDRSAADAQDGLAYTAIYAGSRKNDYSPHTPLSDAARNALQAEVDRLYALFVAHVAAMRGMPEADVRATEAELFFGDNAVLLKLADAVASPAQALTDFATRLLARRHPPSRARAAVLTGMAPHLEDSSMPIDHPTPDDTPDMTSLTEQARRDAAQSAQTIAELCLLAGRPEAAAAYIAAGASEQTVRAELLAAAAQTPEIVSAVGPDHGASLAPQTSPVLAAVRKLFAKE